MLFLLLASTFVFSSCWREKPPAQDPNSQAPVEQNAPPLTDDLSSTSVQEAPPMEPVVENTETSSGSEEKFSGRITDAYAKWGKVTCTMTTSSQKGESMQGTMYLDGKKMKTDMIVTIDGKEVKTHMLLLDEMTYNWDEKTKMWMKMKMVKPTSQSWLENASESDSSSKQGPQGEDKMTYDFDCKAWVDGADFSVPSDIQFQDLSNLQNMIPVMKTQSK